jgi:hypothetical protein
MTVTLEDIAMIIGLPISGPPVSGLCEPVGWHQRVADFVRRNPPDRQEHGKGREAGVHISWLRQEFQHCPEGEDDATVSNYVRAWVRHIFGTVLFPEATRDMASWTYISCLMA